jgi:hypothetical protein
VRISGGLNWTREPPQLCFARVRLMCCEAGRREGCMAGLVGATHPLAFTRAVDVHEFAPLPMLQP